MTSVNQNEIKKSEIQLRVSPNPPYFADEVVVGSVVKAVSRGRPSKKEAYLRLGFVDMIKKQVFVEVTISLSTGKALAKLLEETVKKLEAELEKETEEKPKVIARSTRELEYIG